MAVSSTIGASMTDETDRRPSTLQPGGRRDRDRIRNPRRARSRPRRRRPRGRRRASSAARLRLPAVDPPHAEQHDRRAGRAPAARRRAWSRDRARRRKRPSTITNPIDTITNPTMRGHQQAADGAAAARPASDATASRVSSRTSSGAPCSTVMGKPYRPGTRSALLLAEDRERLRDPLAQTRAPCDAAGSGPAPEARRPRRAGPPARHSLRAVRTTDARVATTNAATLERGARERSRGDPRRIAEAGEDADRAR